MVESFEILRNGTIIEYVLSRDADDRETLRKGKIIAFSEEHGSYHVAEKIGNRWAPYGFLWVRHGDVIRVINENEE